MTVDVRTNRWQMTGNGITTDLPYDNKVFAATDMRVFLDGVEQGKLSGYTVTGVGDKDGGNVSFAVPPAAGVVVIAIRAVPALQGDDLVNNQPVDYEIVETIVDRGVVFSQQLEDQLGRQLALTASDPVENFLPMPFKADLANKALHFNNTGDPIAVEPTDASGTSVTSTISTVSRQLAEHTADILSSKGFVSLNEAVTLIGPAEKTLRIDTSLAVSSNVTVPDNICLFFTREGRINPATGIVVTINGPMIAGMNQLFGGAGTVVLSRKVGYAWPEWFGAVADNTTDDSTAIQACHDACVTNNVPIQLFGEYGIGTKLSWSNDVPAAAAMDSVFTKVGSATDCLDLSDGNYYGLSRFPKITGFSGYAFKLLGTNTANIFIPLISNCGDAFVLETLNATHPNLLDTNIEFQQIGLCTRGIVFKADNAANVMQGNEIKGNFISETNQCVAFDGPATSPNWDSNKVVLQATDPTTSDTTAKVLYNPETYGVVRFTFRVESWCGGLHASAKFIDGKFDDLTCFLNLSQAATDGQFALTGGGNIVDVDTRANAANTPVPLATAAASKGTFNGGAPLYRNWEQVDAVPATDIAVNAVRDFYAYHLLTDNNSYYFQILPGGSGDTKGLVPIRVRDNNAVNANEVVISLRNMSGAIVPASTVCRFWMKSGIL